MELNQRHYLIYIFCVLLSTDLPPDHPNHSYKEMMDRDKRRWAKADKDQDNTLTKEEFTDFLHPEEAEHMRDVVVMVINTTYLL